MKKSVKIFGGLGVVIALMGLISALAPSAGRNDEFKPVNEFYLAPWIDIHVAGIDLSINKAVMYLFIAALLTIGTMLFVANRMAQKPNKVQTAVETVYQVMKVNITEVNMDRKMSTTWFPFIGTLFLFIWFSNMIGYIPLPTNTAHKFDLFGLEIPSFALYAATANISVPIVLTLIVWISYHVVGVKAKGPVNYVKGWIPAGSSGPLLILIVPVEIISQFVRVVSLSVRLFANILAGHLLILFMGGGLSVILGLAALNVITVPVAIVFFLFEIGLVATLQAFIFATLASIYLGEAVSDHH
ncbi:MAG: F0F1 ATP synthase subunit A [Solirubrobacteraceae bacterium]|nr:F0F1 ATP synthase subunit A [Solirubrobacteraceae bacterium]